MAKVSIVVTAYNIEDYIEQCLQSVASQTLRDIEVFVVDDGSSDRTSEKITAFAARDARFRAVLLAANSPGGVATAANAGLDRATSAWVGFVDGDDFVEPTMFEKLLDAAEEHEADLAICQYREVVSDTGEYRYPADSRRWAEFDRPRYHLDIDSRQAFLRLIAVPWRKLYRRSVLEDNQIRFPVGDYFYEDNPFHWYTILSASTIALVPQVLCYHRIGRPGQTMGTADAKLLAIFRHHDSIHSWLTDRGQLDTYQAALVGWSISQTEWICERIPKALRRDLFQILAEIYSQYPQTAIAQALTEARKGKRTRRWSDAILKGDYRAFSAALDDRPDRPDYLRGGLHHLRRFGLRSTLAMLREVLRERFRSTPVHGISARGPSKRSSDDRAAMNEVLFGLMVIQQQILRVEHKMDECRPMIGGHHRDEGEELAVPNPSDIPNGTGTSNGQLNCAVALDPPPGVTAP